MQWDVQMKIIVLAICPGADTHSGHISCSSYSQLLPAETTAEHQYTADRSWILIDQEMWPWSTSALEVTVIKNDCSFPLTCLLPFSLGSWVRRVKDSFRNLSLPPLLLLHWCSPLGRDSCPYSLLVQPSPPAWSKPSLTSQIQAAAQPHCCYWYIAVPP